MSITFTAPIEQRWKAVREHIAKGEKLKHKAEQHSDDGLDIPECLRRAPS
jgi:hypothetical protein